MPHSRNGKLAAVFVAGAFIAGASGARADTFSPSPISIVELLRRARTAEGDLSSGAYHIVLRGVANGETSLEETYSDPRGYKTSETAAGQSSSWGEFEGRRWYQDPNGFVYRVSGAYEQHDPIESAVRTAGTENGGGKLLGVSSSDPATYVVEVAPREGLSERRYYDAATYLLRRVDVSDYDGHTRISEYGDYRKVSGRMVPFSRTYRTDFYSGSRSYTVVTYEGVRASAASLSIPAPRTLFSLQGRDSVTIPAEFTDDGIIVRMNVGQRGLDLLLDSGSSSIVLDGSVAGDLGLALHDKRVESFGGLYSTANAQINDVSIGPLHAATVSIDIAPVDEVLAPVDAGVAETKRAVGLLGCDFIAGGALEVDFPHKSLTLFAQPPANLQAKGWTELPITLDDCVPLAKAAFSGLPGQFILDLGAYDTILYNHYFSQFKASSAPSQGDPVIASGSFIGGDEVRFQTYTMGTLRIGDLLAMGVIVDVPLTKKAQERDYDGLLGRPTLANFVMLFDYAHECVYLKPAT